MRLMSEQTPRRGGVLIEPLEPDDSEERCIIPTIHPHYIELPKLCTESISTEPDMHLRGPCHYSCYPYLLATVQHFSGDR